jgi:hypothetical protein
LTRLEESTPTPTELALDVDEEGHRLVGEDPPLEITFTELVHGLAVSCSSSEKSVQFIDKIFQSFTEEQK